jgi:hypothetical protein
LISILKQKYTSMKFQGQIKKILPARQGVSQRTGNEWKSQPFIFEYFENPSDRYSDTVLLETRDDNIISQLREGLKVTIGFGHHVRDYTLTTGERAGQTQYMNDCRIYHFEPVATANPAPSPSGYAPAAKPEGTGEQQVQQETTGGKKDDGLPF